MSSEADGFLFWHFLQLTASGKCAFNLALVVEKHTGSDESKQELVGHLLRAQIAAVQDIFFEKLRQVKSIDMAKSFVPSVLQSQDFLSESKWFSWF